MLERSRGGRCGAHEVKCRCKESDEGIVISCRGLSWAGIMVSAGCDWWGGRDWAVPASGSLDLEFLRCRGLQIILQRDAVAG